MTATQTIVIEVEPAANWREECAKQEALSRALKADAFKRVEATLARIRARRELATLS